MNILILNKHSCTDMNMLTIKNWNIVLNIFHVSIENLEKTFKKAVSTIKIHDIAKAESYTSRQENHSDFVM